MCFATNRFFVLCVPVFGKHCESLTYIEIVRTLRDLYSCIGHTTTSLHGNRLAIVGTEWRQLNDSKNHATTLRSASLSVASAHIHDWSLLKVHLAHSNMIRLCSRTCKARQFNDRRIMLLNYNTPQTELLESIDMPST